MPLLPLFVQNEISNTLAARMSAFNFSNAWDEILPPPDNTISALDRQHLWGMYIGIPAVLVVAVVGSATVTVFTQPSLSVGAIDSLSVHALASLTVTGEPI